MMCACEAEYCKGKMLADMLDAMVTTKTALSTAASIIA